LLSASALLKEKALDVLDMLVKTVAGSAGSALAIDALLKLLKGGWQERVSTVFRFLAIGAAECELLVKAGAVKPLVALRTCDNPDDRFRAGIVLVTIAGKSAHTGEVVAALIDVLRASSTKGKDFAAEQLAALGSEHSHVIIAAGGIEALAASCVESGKQNVALMASAASALLALHKRQPDAVTAAVIRCQGEGGKKGKVLSSLWSAVPTPLGQPVQPQQLEVSRQTLALLSSIASTNAAALTAVLDLASVEELCHAQALLDQLTQDQGAPAFAAISVVVAALSKKAADKEKEWIPAYLRKITYDCEWRAAAVANSSPHNHHGAIDPLCKTLLDKKSSKPLKEACADALRALGTGSDVRMATIALPLEASGLSGPGLLIFIDRLKSQPRKEALVAASHAAKDGVQAQRHALRSNQSCPNQSKETEHTLCPIAPPHRRPWCAGPVRHLLR